MNSEEAGVTTRRVRFKVCCILDVAEAELALAHGAAAVGLVSRMPSGPGVIDEAMIAEVARAMAGRVATFLLTAETQAPAILEQIERLSPHTVQLVDAVAPAEIAAVRRGAPAVEIVSVIHVAGPDSVPEAVEAAAHADALLLDSGNPTSAVKELGGTGRVHDWSLSRAIVDAVRVPVWLAGGLDPENVTEAIEQVRPAGVDLCSGLRPDRETRVLNPELLARFSEAVRRAGEALHEVEAGERGVGRERL